MNVSQILYVLLILAFVIGAVLVWKVKGVGSLLKFAASATLVIMAIMLFCELIFTVDQMQRARGF